jgi:hypothetical protein
MPDRLPVGTGRNRHRQRHPYELSGGVWSSSSERALAAARSLRTGEVQINGTPFNVRAPFGVYKQSGYSRELGPYGIEEYGLASLLSRVVPVQPRFLLIELAESTRPMCPFRRKWHYRLIRNFSSQITQVRGSRFAVKCRNLLPYFRY